MAYGASTYGGGTYAGTGGLNFDALSVAPGSAAVTSQTWTHVVGGGQNQLLVVGVGMLDALGQTVTGITFNGVPLSQYGAISNGTTDRAELWYLVNPSQGSYSIVVTLSGSTAVSAGATSWTGSFPSEPLGPLATATGVGTALGVTVSSTPGEIVHDVVATAAANLSPGAGQTQRWNAGVAGLTTAGSTKPGDSSVTTAWTSVLSAAWATVAASIHPNEAILLFGGSGASTSTGSLRVDLAIAIGASGASTSSAPTTRVDETYALIAPGASTSTGSLRVDQTYALIGTGTSTTTGTLTLYETYALAGNGSSTASGVLRVDVLYPLVASGSSISTGFLRVDQIYALIGSGISTTISSCRVDQTYALIGTGTSASYGMAVVYQTFSPIVVGSSVSSTPTIRVDQTYALIGSSISVSIGSDVSVYQIYALVGLGTSVSSGATWISLARPFAMAGNSFSSAPPMNLGVLWDLRSQGTGTSAGNCTSFKVSVQSATETLPVSVDVATRSNLFTRRVLEPITPPVDTAVRFANYYRPLFEALPVASDIATRTRLILRQATETLPAITDVWATQHIGYIAVGVIPPSGGIDIQPILLVSQMSPPVQPTHQEGTAVVAMWVIGTGQPGGPVRPFYQEKTPPVTMQVVSGGTEPPVIPTRTSAGATPSP